MLHPAKDLRKLAEPCGARGLLTTGHAGETDEGIQLVDGAVSFNADGILGDPLAAGQGRFAFIAALGVDPIERDPRVVKAPFRHVIHGTCVSMGSS
jgi:hypothetical protein